MTVLCSRIGCSASAVATFAFDGVVGVVWLDPVEDGPRIREWGAGMLCRTHADSLTVPRGWHLQDRRGPAPRLWTDRTPPSRSTPARSARPRPSPALVPDPARTGADALPFTRTSDAIGAGEQTPEWQELGRVLDAHTPLLARAFESARAPHR